MEPTQNNNSNSGNGGNKTLWAVILLIVVALAFFLIMRNKVANDTDINENPQEQVDNTDGIEDTDPVTTPVAVTVPASLSYQQALVTYKDRRIQFDKNCQAIPYNVTYKNGTSIMLDNRAPVARTLNINGPVSIKAYGFKILKLSSSTLPKTILVDCGTGQNVATILLQK